MSSITQIFQLAPGGTLGSKYRLDRCLGDGTYGFVWKAERLIDQTVVAVKIPKHQGDSNSHLEEGKVLLNAPPHDNVVQLFWMGRVPPDRDLFAIEMEFFNSHTLAFLLDARDQKLVASYRYLLHIYGQVLDGICHLHALPTQVTHGDIKPQNILVGGDVAKLTDFGSSLTTQDIYARSRENGGTVLYSPPEFAGLTTRRKAGELAVAHDVYSLGVLLYQLLTGRLPHDTLAQVVRHTPFPRPSELNSSVVTELDDVVMKALELEPQDRWSTVADLRDAFRRARDGQLAYRAERLVVPALDRKRDWSSAVLELMDKQAWRDAEAAARTEYQRTSDPHAFLLMIRAAVRDERYFDAIQLLSASPTMMASESAITGDLEQLALEAFIRTERVNDATRMVDRCLARQGDQPGLLLRKASLLGMQAKYHEASEILLALNRALPRRRAVLRRLVLVFDQMRNGEQADAFRAVLARLSVNKLEAMT